MINDAEWDEYWKSMEEGYMASKLPWAKQAAAAVKQHGDYAGFTGFEEWITEKDTEFAAVYDGMNIFERIALYGLFSDACREA